MVGAHAVRGAGWFVWPAQRNVEGPVGADQTPAEDALKHYFDWVDVI